MFRSLVEKSLVLALLIVIHDAYYLGKTRIVYPRLLEERSTESSLSLYINDEITLNLERADIFPEMFLLRYPEGETEVNKYIKGAYLNNLVYHDTDQMSAVSIERDDGFYVNGIIQNTYQIKPMYHTERSDTGIIAHELVEVEEPHSTIHGDYFAAPLQQPIDLLTPRSTKRKVQMSTAKFVPQYVHPEIMVITDIQTQKSVGQDFKVELYVGLLVASTNLRFTSMRQPRLILRLCSVKVMTETQKTDIYQFVTSNGVTYLELNATLYKFASEIESEDYKNYDMVMLLTHHNAAILKEGTLYTDLRGYAFVGGPCTRRKVSVIKDTGLGIEGASSFAHETAHMLGSPHDGEGPPSSVPNSPGARKCPKSEGYLMGDLFVDMTDRKKYKLSTCSINSIVHLLGLEDQACLLKKNHKIYVPTNQLAGSIITPNQTCENFLGQLNLANGYHDNTDSGLKKCYLTCVTPPNENNEQSFASTAAHDGTPCDISKICKHGACFKKT